MIQENIPAKVGLLELLLASSGVQFVIPAYQRNYTWTANREVKQLLDDIKAVLRGERNKHFIGIIIYLERSLDFSKGERSVIYGQQRLTTLFLSLYAVKELMLERGMVEEASKGLLEKILKFEQGGVYSTDMVACIVPTWWATIIPTMSRILYSFCPRS